MKNWLQRISRLDSHHRLLIGFGVALAVFGFLPPSVVLPTRLVATWIAYALTSLSLVWVVFFLTHPGQNRRFYQLQDSSRTAIFLFVVVAASTSLFAVLSLLRTTKGMSPEVVSQHIALSILAIACSWMLVHTVFTTRYAHIYYDEDAQGNPAKGLDFPNEDQPDYLDFAYFSFVIGMTSQVSDVAVSSKIMRRLALLHGVLSFVFNAIIVALTINTVSGLMS